MITDLNSAELRHILDCMREVHGLGYSKNERVGKIQTTLSVQLEYKQKLEQLRGEFHQPIDLPPKRS